MPATLEAAPGGIRVELEGAGRRVLVFGRERIELPGTHPGGPVPEARVTEDQDGRRLLLLGREEIPLPGGDAPEETPQPGALDSTAGIAARVEMEEGRAVACFAGQRITIAPLALTAQEADSARVLVDDAGRRILLAGVHRIILPADGSAPPAGEARGDPAMVLADDAGNTVLLHAGERTVLPGIALTRDEAQGARVVTAADGTKHLVAGARRIPVPSPSDAPAAGPTRAASASVAAKPTTPAPVAAPSATPTPVAATPIAPAPDAATRITPLPVAATPITSTTVTQTSGASGPAMTPSIVRDEPAVREESVARDELAVREESAVRDEPRVHDQSPVRTSAAAAESAVVAPRAAASGGFTDETPEPQLNLRSEELQEIIGFVPHWLVRWGTTMVFATVALLFAVGWFVRYPDVVGGKVVLTTPEPPVRLVPRASGEVAHLFVADGERVRPGQPLVALRGAARWEDVIALADQLDRFERSLADDAAVRAAAFDPMLNLGDLHPAYAAFLQSLSDYRASSPGGYDAQRVAELERQIADQQAVRDNAVAKQRVLADQLELARRDRDRARAMAAQKLISEADLDRAEAEYLQRRSAVQDGEGAVASVEVQISGARAQVLDLRQRVDNQGRNQVLALRAALATLRGAIARWDQEFVLRAPSAGRVSLFRVLGEHQFVDEGAPLLAIVPEAGGRTVGRVLLASDGAGRVEVGQRVMMRLESFPARQYGAVVGRVTRISQLPLEKRDSDEAQYLVDVAVPADLVTTYRRHLPFRQEMRGDADIITRNRRLISRLFDQVRGSVDPAAG